MSIHSRLLRILHVEKVEFVQRLQEMFSTPSKAITRPHDDHVEPTMAGVVHHLIQVGRRVLVPLMPWSMYSPATWKPLFAATGEARRVGFRDVGQLWKRDNKVQLVSSALFLLGCWGESNSVFIERVGAAGSQPHRKRLTPGRKGSTLPRPHRQVVDRSRGHPACRVALSARPGIRRAAASRSAGFAEFIRLRCSSMSSRMVRFSPSSLGIRAFWKNRPESERALPKSSAQNQTNFPFAPYT